MTTPSFATRVAQHAATVKETIRRERSRAPYGTAERYTKELAKDLGKGKTKCVEQVVSFLVDLATRDQLDGAILIARELQWAAQREYERLHPVAELTLAEAHQAEEHAEGLAEEAETAFAYCTSRANADKYLAASAAHVVARERLDAVVRRMRDSQ